MSYGHVTLMQSHTKASQALFSFPNKVTKAKIDEYIKLWLSEGDAYIKLFRDTAKEHTALRARRDGLNEIMQANCKI
jgi:hypothetical protein